MRKRLNREQGNGGKKVGGVFQLSGNAWYLDLPALEKPGALVTATAFSDSRGSFVCCRAAQQAPDAVDFLQHLLSSHLLFVSVAFPHYPFAQDFIKFHHRCRGLYQ